MENAVPHSDAVFELQQLVARFANCFDTKDWNGLEQCLSPEVYTDYSDLRGTPPETVSRDRFVALRRFALDALRTHHLAGNVEIALTGSRAALKVSMVIHRRDDAGESLTTHCLYLMGVEQRDSAWTIDSITQKVLMTYGNQTVHKGIVPSV